VRRARLSAQPSIPRPIRSCCENEPAARYFAGFGAISMRAASGTVHVCVFVHVCMYVCVCVCVCVCVWEGTRVGVILWLGERGQTDGREHGGGLSCKQLKQQLPMLPALPSNANGQCSTPQSVSVTFAFLVLVRSLPADVSALCALNGPKARDFSESTSTIGGSTVRTAASIA